MLHCAECGFPLPDNAKTRWRAKVSKSGKVYCNHECRGKDDPRRKARINRKKEKG